MLASDTEKELVKEVRGGMVCMCEAEADRERQAGSATRHDTVARGPYSRWKATPAKEKKEREREREEKGAGGGECYLLFQA